jgi:hypothetical protein
MDGTRYGIEPFDVGYGASFAAEAESPFDIECEVVEDGGVIHAHEPEQQPRPRQIAFIDGTMRTEARLTRTGPDGIVHTGLAGSWAVGAAMSEDGEPLDVGHVATERVVVFCGGLSVRLPEQPAGWSWVADAVEGEDMPLARQRLQRRMRDAEGELAEQLCEEGRATVVDGPLNNVRRTRTVPIIGYVKTHQRRMLAPENWARVPHLGVRQRSGVFAAADDLYCCYLRVGDAGPWASPWAGIVRLEVPAGAGRRASIDALDAAASWLPRYASALHRDKRAPVNLTPVAGLERALRRWAGDARLAERAVRDAIIQLNGTGGAS